MNAQETQPNEGINDNPGEMELNADENAAGTTHLNEPVTNESEIEKITADLQEQKDKYLRLMAEFDNFRRRIDSNRFKRRGCFFVGSARRL